MKTVECGHIKGDLDVSTVVAHFEISYTQLLDEQGHCHGSLPAFAKDSETLLNLYQTMVRIRTFDKKAIALQRTGKMGTYAPINGQEAISTAIGHAITQPNINVALSYLKSLPIGEVMNAAVNLLVIQKICLFVCLLPPNVCMQQALPLHLSIESNLGLPSFVLVKVARQKVIFMRR